MNALKELIRVEPFDCPIHGAQTQNIMMGRAQGCNACIRERMRDIDAKREDSEREQRAERLTKAIGLPYDVKNAQLRDWKITDPRQTRVLEAVTQWIKASLSGTVENLILLGPTGSGKSHIAAAAAKAHTQKGIDARWVKSSAFVDEVRDSWSKKESHEHNVYMRYAKAGLLVIDEVGQRDRTENAQELLGELAYHRFKRGPTIITSNLTEEALEQHLGDRAADRLLSGALIINCNWPSYRAHNKDRKRI